MLQFQGLFEDIRKLAQVDTEELKKRSMIACDGKVSYEFVVGMMTIQMEAIDEAIRCFSNVLERRLNHG